MTLLSKSNLKPKMSGEIVLTACFLHNQTLNTKFTGISLFQNWHDEILEYNFLRVIGWDAFCHIPTELRKGFAVKAQKCTSVGYAQEQKAYRLWKKEFQKVIISRDVIFNEQLYLNYSISSVFERDMQAPPTEENIKGIIVQSNS